MPAAACFDTAFHATLDAAAATYALPAAWRERWSVRRYGFHGLSHSWVARRAAAIAGRRARQPRIVSCHLGAGASLCAIAGGRSRDTTMGFTPLEGLVMATRSGSVDPGLLLWLLDDGRLSRAQLEEGLEHQSGLAALAGTPDMREVLERAGRGEDAATLALEVYLHRLRAEIASMAAALGGLDVIAFTGGVGEHAPLVRERAVAGLAFLGAAVDPAINAARAATPTSRPPVRACGRSSSARARTSRSPPRRAPRSPRRLGDPPPRDDGEADAQQMREAPVTQVAGRCAPPGRAQPRW